MRPRVSVIVPSYNHARFLRPAVESVVNQSFADWELVLVDDCSSDDSVAVARAFADPRIRVLTNENNLGTYGTQSRALEVAQGEYVAVLNSDDLWEPDKLRVQVEALDAAAECTFCYVLGWKIDAEGVVDRIDDVHADWPMSERQELIPWLLFENRILASGVLFRRVGLGFESTCRYSGDWVALLAAAKRGPCACVADRLTYWRIHGDNTFTASQNQLIEEIRVREAIARGRDWFSPRLDPDAVRSGLARNAMNLEALYSIFLAGSARMAALAALKLHPEKRKVLKRALAAFLPLGILRNRLWADKLDWTRIDAAAGREAIRTQPPLELRVSE